MLWEAWQYFTTPVALPLAKQMGFLEEAIAMAARRKRCKATWGAHFQHCQAAIMEASEQCSQKRIIVIMGAGSLLDVPLAFLANNFAKVVLIDLVFLNAARKMVRPYTNVILLEQDITGVLEGVLNGQVKLDERSKKVLEFEDVDCLVSLNLLSQLPLIPVSWAMKHFKVTELQAGAMAKKLIQDHLELLNRCTGVKCLIADRWVTELDAQNHVLDAFDPLWEVRVPEPQRFWDWTVIPLGESHSKVIQQNRVGLNIY